MLLAGVLAALSFAANHSAAHSGESQQQSGEVFYRYSTSLLTVVGYAILLGLVLLIARGIRTRETFALRRPPSWPTALRLTLGALGAAYLLEILLSPSVGQGNQPDQGVPTFWDASRLPQFALSFAAIAVVAPAVEELMCRGLGFALFQPFGERAAIVGTAVPFGLMHGFVSVLPVFVAIGLALGWVRSRTGSVYPAMLMHSTVNALAVILSVSLGPPT